MILKKWDNMADCPTLDMVIRESISKEETFKLRPEAASM